MNPPLVTVIVVSYNHARYIRENLDSIKAQTYPNIELIVADDASQDNSTEIFDAWLQENSYPAQKNYHTQNTGLAITLNECVALASGKYIKIIAADDYLHCESVESCVKRLEELGENYGMVFTDIFTIDERGYATTDIFQYETSSFFENDSSLQKIQLLRYNCIIAPSVLMRAKTLKETGEYRPGFILEDHDRWLRINQLKKIGFISKKLCYYRVVSTGLTLTRRNEMIAAGYSLKMEYDKTGIIKDEINRYFSNLYYSGERPSKTMLKQYGCYKYHIKRIKFAYLFRIPPTVMRKINRIQSLYSR